MKKILTLFTVLFFISILSFAREKTVENTVNQFTTPKPFMDLFYDFTGNRMPGYPKGKVNASSALMSAMEKNNILAASDGPLILFIDSSLYVYDGQGKQKLSMNLRASPHSGFFPMTAMSHIGAALAYYAKVKEQGGKAWRSGLSSMLKDIKAVRRINASKDANWLDELHSIAWAPHKKAIQDMVDYACAKAGTYIYQVLNGKSFTEHDLNKDFLSGTSKTFPIPYNNVMVATFMLTAEDAVDDVYESVLPLKLDWLSAKVIIRSVAGMNLTAGLTKETNWYVPLVMNLSEGQLKLDRIFIVPYAKVYPSMGKKTLSEEALNYYRHLVWGTTYNRSKIAKEVFRMIPDIILPNPPDLPGNYDNTTPSDINAFMQRLKFSFGVTTQMLSDTVGFWMVGEFAAKKGDIQKLRYQV